MNQTKGEGTSNIELNSSDQNLKRGLENYLECERLLNTFFASVTYCVPECLSQNVGKYRVRMDMPGDPTQFPGNVGCCPYNEFDTCNYSSIANRDLLKKIRLEKHGKPKEDSLACGYHTSDGCTLKDYKSPVCIAYVCPEFSHHVYEQHGIIYVKDEIEQDLELILSGKQPLEEVERFKDLIRGFIEKTRTKPILARNSILTR